MFVRNVESELKKWSLRTDRKPLVLRGARQVGKTTVVNKFGEQFDNYLYINLEKTSANQLVESTDDVKKLMPLLFLYCNKPRKEGKTLLFIDEIQTLAETATGNISLLYGIPPLLCVFYLFSLTIR